MNTTAQIHLEMGLRAHANGDLESAELLYRKVLSIDPNCVLALGWLGTIEAQRNNFSIARPLLEKALVGGNDPDFLLNYANLLQATYHYEQAVEIYLKMIKIRCSQIALSNLAACYNELKQSDKSLYFSDKALSIDPNYAEAWSNRGNALNDLKRHEEALVSCERSIKLKPDCAEAWSNRGIALNNLRRHEEALASCERSIELKPSSAEAWSNRGNTLRDLRRHEEALTSYERSIKLKPDYAEAWSNRGIALNDLKRYEEALASYERSIELKPDYAEAWSNRGNALNDLGRQEDALASHERAIALKPDCAEAWNNLGFALNDLKRYKEALESYERSTELKPDFAEAIYNKSLLQLSQKNFLSGFENYIWRWKARDFFSSHIRTTLPLCNSTSFPKNILLWAEQGLGDEIFYAGLLTQALDKYSNISLISDKRLHPIFARSFPQIELIDRDRAKSESFDIGFDAQAPIGDLGYLLAPSNDEIKASRRSFLIADQVKKAAFRIDEPFVKKKIVCGLAWRSANKDFGTRKSFELIQLTPILKNPKFEFINLQYGQVNFEIQKSNDQLGINIHQIKDLDVYNDIDSLLALIDACDIVITTSNVTAHLAGSIGKKGCVLVPFSKGKIWYWHLNDVSSFWYPSLRVFYQTDRYDWSTTIEQTQKWLEQDVLWNR